MAKSVAVAARRNAQAVNQSGGLAGKRHPTPVVAWMIGDGMVGRMRTGIRETCSGAGRSRTGVRVLTVAVKRVMTVERRGTGRWKHE